MKFCSKCDNLLFPKNGKLYCKSCGSFYDLQGLEKEEYIISKTIAHDEEEEMPIIMEENDKINVISSDERKAFEEYFNSDQDIAVS